MRVYAMIRDWRGALGPWAGGTDANGRAKFQVLEQTRKTTVNTIRFTEVESGKTKEDIRSLWVLWVQLYRSTDPDQ